MKHESLHGFDPIRLSFADGRSEIIICSVEEAAEELLTKWPVDDGEWFYEAVKACLDCLDGNIEAESARHAVIGAARDAGFEVHNGT